ncbi:MAG TPA: YeeE/YedE family protein [Dissulfurispiraceae bacterium]
MGLLDKIFCVMTAVCLGSFLGFIMQRGRFCLNSAFRDIFFLRDYTLFRAYLVCVVVAIIGSNLMEDLGLLMTINEESGEIVRLTLVRQNFVPVANIVGGFLFGLGIVLAGGCASGIVFRFGEGQAAALVSIAGFLSGIVVTSNGPLSPVHNYLKIFDFEILGKRNPALWDLFGQGPLVKWLTIAVFSALALVFISKGNPFHFVKKGVVAQGYPWELTGLYIGILATVAWWISSFFGGVPQGLAITLPLRDFFTTLLSRTSHAPLPGFSFLGIFKGSWGIFFTLAIPLGAFLSAKDLHEFKWRTPNTKEVVTGFSGGILMGVGAVFAGGCNLGHGITGISTMAVSSFVTVAAIVLGNWTMVYFRFIKAVS